MHDRADQSGTGPLGSTARAQVLVSRSALTDQGRMCGPVCAPANPKHAPALCQDSVRTPLMRRGGSQRPTARCDADDPIQLLQPFCAAAANLSTRNDPFGPTHLGLGDECCQIALQIGKVVVPQPKRLQLGSKIVTARENPMRLFGGRQHRRVVLDVRVPNSASAER